MRFVAAGADPPLLEGRLRLPGGPPRGGVVLAHPHPAFGGSMDNWLLPVTAERLAASGWAVLRLNTRGTGGSEGTFDGGLGEVDDVLGAVARLQAELPAGAPTALVGWSFGALVALRAALRPGAPAFARWVGIAPVTRATSGVPIAGPIPPDVDGCPTPRTVIVGEHDQFFPPADATLLEPDAVHVVGGADHFFFDRDEDVAALVAAALET